MQIDQTVTNWDHNFCNRAPIIWPSKQQSTVKSSTFGSEEIAMKNAMDLIEALHYKLRMFGIPVEEPTCVLCDHQAVIRSTIMPKSTLKRKHNSIAYHRNCECIAAATAIVGKVDTDNNLADLGTKVLPLPKRRRLLEILTW